MDEISKHTPNTILTPQTNAAYFFPSYDTMEDIFAAASAAAEYELERTAESRRARASAVAAAERARAEMRAAIQLAYDTTVIFLVWPEAITAYHLRDGRTVYAPWHKCLGTRLHEYGYYVDAEEPPIGAAYYTAEELGFVNAELVAHSRDLESLRDAMGWKRFGGPPRSLRYRVHRVTNAIQGQMAAWHRRRAAVTAWARMNPHA